MDITHWLLPFASRSEVEGARKSATPAVLKATLTSFKTRCWRKHVAPSTRPTQGCMVCLHPEEFRSSWWKWRSSGFVL